MCAWPSGLASCSACTASCLLNNIRTCECPGCLRCFDRTCLSAVHKCRRCSRFAAGDGNHVCRSLCPTTSSSGHHQQASQPTLTWPMPQRYLYLTLLILPTLPALAVSGGIVLLAGSQGLHTALMLLSPMRTHSRCPAQAQQRQGMLSRRNVGVLPPMLLQQHVACPASSRCRLHPPAPCRGATVRLLLTFAWQRTLLQCLPCSRHQQLLSSAHPWMGCLTRRPLRLQHQCWRTSVRMSLAR